jgi:asparagine synthase (glutamine-hydrolysing)
MCGIAGFCDFNKKSDKKTLIEMTEALHHRGPDDSGYSFYEDSYANIGLGHRRLSILDLSSHGHQPMRFENLEIVYNGEVYNFKEIRRELEKCAYKFESESDTEVVLKAYHKWGIKAIDKFNGMFSMAIYDVKINKLILIRDRAGIKPCYYYSKNGLILFSSELKSFHKHLLFQKNINIDAAAQFLHYGYILEPYSIFNDTFKLKAGHYLEIDIKKRKIKQLQYWSLEASYKKSKYDLTESEAVSETDKLLKSACEYRMISDVPTGIFLSGGYDSSAVAALLQSNRTNKIKTFTIGFKEKGYDEAPFAKKVAKYLGTDHTEYYCTAKDALDIIPTLPEIYDEPFGDNSAIPSILVSKLARQNVTVSLSADAGDEIFAGYSKYDRALNYYNLSKKIPDFIQRSMNNIDPSKIPFSSNIYNFTTRYEKMKNILKSRSVVESLMHTSILFTDIELKKLFKKEFILKDNNFYLDSSFSTDLDKMLMIDYKTYLPDNILTKVDRATMSVGLEGREPLLDYRIVEFAARLPERYKYRRGQKKWILKEVVHKYVPKEMMNRPKKGFGIPLAEWLKDDLKDLLVIYLDPSRIQKEGVFNPDEVLKLRDSYLNGDSCSARKIWHILMFEMWFEKWM